MNCEKHGTPLRVEEVREHPGKTVMVCDGCRAEAGRFWAPFTAAPTEYRRNFGR